MQNNEASSSSSTSMPKENLKHDREVESSPTKDKSRVSMDGGLGFNLIIQKSDLRFCLEDGEDLLKFKTYPRGEVPIESVKSVSDYNEETNSIGSDIKGGGIISMVM